MFDHCLYFNTTALARLLEKEWTAAFAASGNVTRRLKHLLGPQTFEQAVARLRDVKLSAAPTGELVTRSGSWTTARDRPTRR